MAQALRERIAPFGVVPGQFAQLLALYEQDGLSQRELCERGRIEKPTMANTIQRMARDLEDDLVGAARGIISQAARNIGDDELANFIDTLSRIIDNLGAIPERR